MRDFGAIPDEIVMLGVKATQGDRFVDPTLQDHRDGARARGFDLVKYFHVAEPGDPVAQADRLAAAVGPLAPNECLVLDVERSEAGPGAVSPLFVDDFYGRLLALGLARPFDLWYGSRDVWAMMGGGGWVRAVKQPIGLWAPRYRSGGYPPHLPPPWDKWTIWQWTDGGATGDLYSCPGVGECDANIFNGTRDELLAWMAGE